MVLFGIKFIDDPSVRVRVGDMIKENSEKDVAKLLFNVDVGYIGTDILIVNKEFIASKTMNLMFSVLLLGASVPWLFWGISLPLFIIAGLMSLWAVLSSKVFNYLMFKLMIKKNIIVRSKTRLL